MSEVLPHVEGLTQTYNRSMNRWLVTVPGRGRLLRYRWIMEQELGRVLRSDELVHHLNGDPTDDRPTNLNLITRAEHLSLHHADTMAAKRRYAWSCFEPCCVACGTTQRKHWGRGLCKRCYSRDPERGRFGTKRRAA